MKITWYSNAPWTITGYGTQTAQVAKRIKADGHDIAIANNYGLEGDTIFWKDIPVFPKSYAPHSEDIIASHDAFFRGDDPGWIITLYDVWPLPVEQYRGQRIASWTPVDHWPVPPGVIPWASEHYTIAMSEFGQKALADAGIAAQYAPHAIETSIFRPTPSDFRARNKIPDDAFLVVVNAANKGGTPVRKCWSEMLSAFTIFAADHPDAYLYINTHLDGIMNAPRLGVLIQALGIAEKVRVVDQYLYLASRVTESMLAEMYTAGDVLLSTSTGEGFGICVVEAQACGTPVIVSDFTAQPELVGAGWKVGGQPEWDHYYAAWMHRPHVKQIVGALNAAYERRADTSLRDDAVAFAAGYDADLIYNKHWRPILADLEAQLKPPSRQVKRAVKRKRR